MKNKKAISNIGIMVLIFAAFLIVIIMGIFALIFYNVDNYLSSLNINVGAANLTDINDNTLGKISNGFLDSVDMISYVLIFSLILFMFVNAYFSRDKYPKLMIIIDILLLVFYYVVAVYISNAYYMFINSSSFLNVYPDYLPKASRLVMNLPLIVGIVGAIMMILTYSKLPKDEYESTISDFEA